GSSPRRRRSRPRRAGYRGRLRRPSERCPVPAPRRVRQGPGAGSTRPRGAWSWPLPYKTAGEVGKDGRGYSPDAMTLPLDLDVRPDLAEPFALLVRVVGRIEQVAERRLEPRGHLARVGHERQVGRDKPEHRRDVVTAAGDEAVASPDHPHGGRVHREFLARLAQGRFDRV